MTEISQSKVLELLNLLKEQITEKELDALVISHDDEYLSNNLTPDCERIATLTGFTGSAGFVCITNIDQENLPLELNSTKEGSELSITHPQAVFVDGRYKVQVKEQIDLDIYDAFNYSDLSPAEYLGTILPKKSKVGIDLNCISYKYYIELQQALTLKGIELVGLSTNLFDLIWEDRPEAVCTPVQIYPDEFNGCPSMQKRKNLAKALRERGLDATIISRPENICWLLNIRGRDRKYLPVINCRLVAYANEALEWYVNLDHLDDEVQASLEEHVGHIDIFQESAFNDVLERLTSSSCTIYIDNSATNANIINTLYTGGAKVVEGLDLCDVPKACKNNTEIAGEHNAHLKDGIAICRFLAWLDDQTKPDHISDEEAYLRRVEDLDEAVLAEKAEYFRKIEGDYLEPSFATISALGPNAAMCHYNHEEVATPRKFGSDPLYLIDSGAHYLEGTTDITRTILVGPNLTEQMQKMYTLVLKAHIALASTIFPHGTSGMQLDAIARRPLWEYGFDYEHGTGHGVGHLLAVHEGPHNISTRSSNIPLEVGMVVSIEPGFYLDNEFGIRLENLVVVSPCTQQDCKHMLCFEPLTLVPFDQRLIIREMLSPNERAWLNEYHQNVYSMIKNKGTTLSDMEVNFLTQATAPI